MVSGVGAPHRASCYRRGHQVLDVLSNFPNALDPILVFCVTDNAGINRQKLLVGGLTGLSLLLTHGVCKSIIRRWRYF